MNPRAIALCGIGYGALSMAVQGFATAGATPVPESPVAASGARPWPRAHHPARAGRENDEALLLVLL